MSEFLRQPKSGVVEEGQTFTDVRHGEVIAQQCYKGKCVEVRKSLEKNGEPVSSDEKLKIIDQAKKELTEKCSDKPKKAKKKWF